MINFGSRRWKRSARSSPRWRCTRSRSRSCTRRCSTTRSEWRSSSLSWRPPRSCVEACRTRRVDSRWSWAVWGLVTVRDRGDRPPWTSHSAGLSPRRVCFFCLELMIFVHVCITLVVFSSVHANDFTSLQHISSLNDNTFSSHELVNVPAEIRYVWICALNEKFYGQNVNFLAFFWYDRVYLLILSCSIFD